MGLKGGTKNVADGIACSCGCARLFVPATNFIEKYTNKSKETRRCIDEDHFQAYLKKIKNGAEKVIS